LSHSHPYLTPKAAQLLEDIGKRYRKKLDENGMGNYAYHITSLLRTKESQKSLSRSNMNASSNTSHLYGTTFDIAYRSVSKKPLPFINVEVSDAKAIRLLSETIGELRRERRCVVVTERIEKCFHITVIQ
jgi:transcriptional regulatory protein LevR